MKAARERERNDGERREGQEKPNESDPSRSTQYPQQRLLSSSHSDLYCTKKEKTQYSQLFIEVEFIIQLLACRWARVRAAKHLCPSIQKQPSQYFLIKHFTSSRKSVCGCSARLKHDCIDASSCLDLELVLHCEFWCHAWLDDTVCPVLSCLLACILLSPLCATFIPLWTS